MSVDAYRITIKKMGQSISYLAANFDELMEVLQTLFNNDIVKTVRIEKVKVYKKYLEWMRGLKAQ